jgi:hypothetical protein
VSPRERQSVEGGFPEPWKPAEEGETLEGIYKGFDDVTVNNRTFRSYRIQNEDTKEFFGIAGGMLKNAIERVPVGTYIWVTYKGKVETQNGEAKDFEVECEKGTKLLDPPTSGELTIPEGS